MLGASTWNLIHTIAEHISEYPDEVEQKQITSFIETLSALYPCHICQVRRYIYIYCDYLVGNLLTLFILFIFIELLNPVNIFLYTPLC